MLRFLDTRLATYCRTFHIHQTIQHRCWWNRLINTGKLILCIGEFDFCFTYAVCSYPTLAKCYNPVLSALSRKTIDDNFDYSYLNSDSGLNVFQLFDYSNQPSTWWVTCTHSPVYDYCAMRLQVCSGKSSYSLWIINVPKLTSLNVMLRTTIMTPVKPQISKFKAEKFCQNGL